jgi:Ca2+-binding RTX toxin-like protein
MRTPSGLRPVLACGSLVVATLVGSSSAARAAGETCHGRPATIVVTSSTPVEGTDGNDVIVVTTRKPTTIDAMGGDDFICGGPGADDISGGTGNDFINGGDGNDVLAGESTFQTSPTAPADDNDDVRGGHGNDEIVDDWGDDLLVAGRGHDTLRLGVETDDPVDAGCTPVEASARLSVGSSTVTGFGVDVFHDFETYVGGVASSTIFGTHGADVIRSGQCGKAQIVGEAGADHLRGESAAGGWIAGGPGRDQIVVSGPYAVGAGPGADTIRLDDSSFAFTDGSTVDGGPGHDWINDGSGLYDKIALGHGLSRDGAREISLRRVENAQMVFPDVIYSPRILLVGDNGPNTLVAPTSRLEHPHTLPTVLRGLGGNDRLLAHHGDTANGGPGRDFCRAQHRIACERP